MVLLKITRAGRISRKVPWFLNSNLKSWQSRKSIQVTGAWNYTIVSRMSLLTVRDCATGKFYLLKDILSPAEISVEHKYLRPIVKVHSPIPKELAGLLLLMSLPKFALILSYMYIPDVCIVTLHVSDWYLAWLNSLSTLQNCCPSSIVMFIVCPVLICTGILLAITQVV